MKAENSDLLHGSQKGIEARIAEAFVQPLLDLRPEGLGFFQKAFALCRQDECGFTPVFTSASALNMDFFLIVVALATPTKANITTTRLTDFIVCSFPQILLGGLKSYV